MAFAQQPPHLVYCPTDFFAFRNSSLYLRLVGSRGPRVSASVLKTAANLKSPEFEKNTRRIVDLLTTIKNEEEQIRQGGGAKAIESQHKKGHLTARERIAKLIVTGSQFFVLGIYAAFEMYEEWGGAPSAVTVTGLAK